MVIDPDYRGQIIMAVHNDSDRLEFISPNDRIGQLIVFPRYEWVIKEVDDLDKTTRATGGFGSTGK